MDCGGVEQAIREQGRLSSLALNQNVLEHVKGCVSCQKLMHSVERLDPPPPLSPALIRQIHARMAGHLRPVKPLLPAGYFAAAFFTAVALVTGLSLLLLRPLGIPAMGTWPALAVLSLLMLVMSLLIDSLTRQMIPGSLHRVSPAWILPLALLVLGVFLWSRFPRHGVVDFWKTGWVCLRTGLLFAIPVGVVLFRILRKGAAMSPRMTGATAGLIAGLSGVTVLEVHCPLLEASHIIIWHLGAALLSALAGASLSSLLDSARGHSALTAARKQLLQ